MQIGLIGLGKMGSRMASKILSEGHEVVVWNRSPEPVWELKFKVQNSKFKITAQKLKVKETVEALVKSLTQPRIIWLMLPQGAPTEEILNEVSKYAEREDIVIDGGNAYYKDTEKRYKDLKKKGIKYLGIGVSGGIIATEQGYPLMVGGDKSAYQYIVPLLDCLAKPHGGHEYFGQGGAGHFVKMVHNAIEYGYMQAIGEGFGVLQKSDYSFDLEKVARLYQKGTLICGFMMERTIEVLQNDPRLEKITGVIGSASLETVWTVDEAKEKGLFIENIEQAMLFRNRSKTDEKIQKSFAARMVSSLRQAFGGHEVKKK